MPLLANASSGLSEGDMEKNSTYLALRGVILQQHLQFQTTWTNQDKPDTSQVSVIMEEARSDFLLCTIPTVSCLC